MLIYITAYSYQPKEIISSNHNIQPSMSTHDDLEDGMGCAEIWEKLSREREEEQTD